MTTAKVEVSEEQWERFIDLTVEEPCTAETVHAMRALIHELEEASLELLRDPAMMEWIKTNSEMIKETLG